MSRLENAVNRTISDFDSIKKAIVDMGVEVPKGTDTSEYGSLIKQISDEEQKEAAYQRGYTEGYDDGNSKGYQNGYEQGNTDGYSSGYNTGFSTGKGAGYTEGYEQGIDEGNKTTWKFLLNSGSRTDYTYAFAHTTPTVDIFKPCYDMKPTLATYMFAWIYQTMDLAKQLEDCGVSLDFSACTNMTMCFYTCYFARLGVLDVRKAWNLNRMFEGSYIVTIDKLILNSHDYTNTFYNARNLKNLTIEGRIANNNFNVSWSTKLTHDSLMSIINALVDKTNDTSATWKITLGSTNLAKLTTDELDMIEAKGWTYG